MTAVRSTPHLYFRGQAEAALRFYAACGLGAIVELRHQAPPAWADGEGDWVLHAVFEGPGIRLCAGDGADTEVMKGCAILLEFDDSSEAEQLFDRLSAGGTVGVGFAMQAFGVRYGNFTDRFGVQWSVTTR